MDHQQDEGSKARIGVLVGLGVGALGIGSLIAIAASSPRPPHQTLPITYSQDSTIPVASSQTNQAEQDKEPSSYQPGILTSLAQGTMDDVKAKVADDAVKEYNITARAGSKADMCVHAGMAAAAFLQAQDEENYTHWRGVEQADCAIAGMPTL